MAPFIAATLAATPADASGAANAASAERGRVLIERYHCGRCHTVPGVAAARSTVAASLAGYGRRSYIVGRLPNGREALARWIADPAATVPGTAMPDMGVPLDDARDIAAYLATLR